MSNYVPTELRHKARTHFQECCAYYRTPARLTIAIFEIEHIVPQVSGGPTDFENLCFACPTCNRYKGTRQSMREPLTGKEIALFHPQQQSWDDHFAWSVDRTMLQGLSDIGRATIQALRMNRPDLVRLRRMWIQMGEFPPHVGAAG